MVEVHATTQGLVRTGLALIRTSADVLFLVCPAVDSLQVRMGKGAGGQAGAGDFRRSAVGRLPGGAQACGPAQNSLRAPSVRCAQTAAPSMFTKRAARATTSLPLRRRLHTPAPACPPAPLLSRHPASAAIGDRHLSGRRRAPRAPCGASRRNQCKQRSADEQSLPRLQQQHRLRRPTPHRHVFHLRPSLDEALVVRREEQSRLSARMHEA
jgi:hypothetical protein